MKHIIYGPGVLGGKLGAKVLLEIIDYPKRRILLPNEFLLTYWPDALKAIAANCGTLPVTRVSGLTHEVLSSIVMPQTVNFLDQNGNLFEEEIMSLGVAVTSVRQGLRNSYNWSFNQRLMPEENAPDLESFQSSV
jgi:hypothetical protein